MGPVFNIVEITERLTLPHPTMAWPWAEIKVGTHDGGWFYGVDYTLAGGEGGGGPCADGPHVSRSEAVLAGVKYLRSRIGDRLANAPLHSNWLDGIERELEQPSLFEDAA